LGYWENVANSESGFFTAIDEGTGVKTFGCNESFFAEFVAVRVAEDDTGEGCTATSIMDDLFNYSTDVTVTFCKV
jgi:hypothetical protein